MTADKRSAAVTPPAITTSLHSARSAGLDALRGVAVLLMLLDHVLVVTDAGELVRGTLTRFAMPLFFVLAGHLAGRPSARWAGVALLGLFLPAVVPWIDSPNVLLWYVLGALLLAWQRAGGLPPWFLGVVCSIPLANGWDWGFANSYDPYALVALMSLGAMVPRRELAFMDRFPPVVVAPLAAVGCRPLSWYVGHLVALQAVVLLI